MDPLKELLFEKVAQALRSYEQAQQDEKDLVCDGYQQIYHEKVVYARHQRFIALYDVIEAAELEDEYQAWKQAQP